MDDNETAAGLLEKAYLLPNLFIAALFVVAIAVGIAVPAQALPHFVESKGVTYVANVNGAPRVLALATSGATLLWSTVLPPLPADISLSLALEKDVLYVTGYSDSVARATGFVFALDAVTGQILWMSSMPGGGIYSSAAVSKGVVYVAGGGVVVAPSRVSALNAETGDIIWQTIFPFPSYASPTIDKDAVVLVSGGFGSSTRLLVLVAATGEVLQDTPVP